MDGSNYYGHQAWPGPSGMHGIPSTNTVPGSVYQLRWPENDPRRAERVRQQNHVTQHSGSRMMQVPFVPPHPPPPDLTSIAQNLETELAQVPPFLRAVKEKATNLYQIEELPPDVATIEVKKLYDDFRKLSKYMNEILQAASEGKFVKDHVSNQLERAKVLPVEEKSDYFLKALSCYLFTTVPACACIKTELHVLLGRIVRLLNHYFCSGTLVQQEIAFQAVLSNIERKISGCQFKMSTIILLWKLIQMYPADLKPDERFIFQEHLTVGFKGFSIELNKLLMDVAATVSKDRQDPIPPDDAADRDFSFEKDMELAEYLLHSACPIVLPDKEIFHQNQREASCLLYRIPLTQKKLPGAVEIQDPFDLNGFP